MSDEQKELSIQEEVAAALRESEGQKEPEVPAPGSEAPEIEQEDKTAARDDKGRFAPKSEEKTSETIPEEDTTKKPLVEEPTPHLSKDKPPSSWSPTVREKWRDLPEDVRTEIIRREEAGAAGVRKIQEELAPVRHLSESLAAFYDEARQHGVAPQDFNRHVSSTMAAERALRNPDPAGRFEALLGIADTYGIPLRQLLQVPPQAGQQQPPQPVVPPQVQQELEASRQWREQQLSSKAEETVTQWSKGKEFFEDVRQDMAFLVESGRATDLDTAYDMACGMNAEVRKVLETRRGSQDQIKQRQEAAEKANLAKSTSVVEPEVVEDPDDVYSIVRSQMLKSGRT